jgi:hypothetical protein
MRKLLVVTALLLFAGIAFGQTLQKNGVVAIHMWTVKLNPDVTMNQFLKFWEEDFIPTFEEAIPEMKAFVIKGAQDHNKYQYGGLYVWESMEELRKYFNSDGSPTENAAPALEKMTSMMDEIAKYGEFTYTADDYVIIQ